MIEEPGTEDVLITFTLTVPQARMLDEAMTFVDRQIHWILEFARGIDKTPEDWDRTNRLVRETREVQRLVAREIGKVMMVFYRAEEAANDLELATRDLKEFEAKRAALPRRQTEE